SPRCGGWLRRDHGTNRESSLRGRGNFLLVVDNDQPSELPVVIATGSVLRRPTPGELAGYLGLTVDSIPDRSDMPHQRQGWTSDALGTPKVSSNDTREMGVRHRCRRSLRWT